MMYTFFEKKHMHICDQEMLNNLKANELLYDSKIDILDYLSDDIEVLKKRSVVFSDALHVPGLFALLQSISKKISSISDILRSESEIGDKERSIFSAKQLQLYFEIIDEADNYYLNLPETAIISSEEFKALFDRIHGIACSNEYLNLKKGANKLIERITHIKSISVGFNFDARLSPIEMGVISINDQYIESGKLIDKILRMDFSANGLQAIEPIVVVDKTLTSDDFDILNNSLLRSVDKIFTRSVRDWPKDIKKYIENNLFFLLELLPDLQFIITVTKIHNILLESGVPMCLPNYYRKEEKIFKAKQLYNPVLAVQMSEKTTARKLVGNDIEFDHRGYIYILTGPNNGGKSVFIVSVGIAQIFAQLGMLIPAEKIDISPVDRIYIHFPQSINKEKTGRLEEECIRIKKMFESMNKYSLCLFDETFSSTDSEEGCQLAFEMLRAIENCGAYAIYGTHFHHLVRRVDEAKVENGKCKGFDYLSAGISDGKTRTYRITRCKPDGKSYASDIAKKYGLSFEELTKSHKYCDI